MKWAGVPINCLNILCISLSVEHTSSPWFPIAQVWQYLFYCPSDLFGMLKEVWTLLGSLTPLGGGAWWWMTSEHEEGRWPTQTEAWLPWACLGDLLWKQFLSFVPDPDSPLLMLTAERMSDQHKDDLLPQFSKSGNMHQIVHVMYNNYCVAWMYSTDKWPNILIPVTVSETQHK